MKTSMRQHVLNVLRNNSTPQSIDQIFKQVSSATDRKQVGNAVSQIKEIKMVGRPDGACLYALTTVKKKTPPKKAGSLASILEPLADLEADRHAAVEALTKINEIVTQALKVINDGH